MAAKQRSRNPKASRWLSRVAQGTSVKFKGEVAAIFAKLFTGRRRLRKVGSPPIMILVLVIVLIPILLHAWGLDSLPQAGTFGSKMVLPLLLLISLLFMRRPQSISEIDQNAVVIGAIALFLFSVTLSILVLAALSTGSLDLASRGTLLRDVALPSLVVVGGYIAIWRGVVAARDADTAAEVLSREKLARAVEMLGNKNVATRIGGITILRELDSEEPEKFGEIIMRVLLAYVSSADPPGENNRDLFEHLLEESLVPASEYTLDSPPAKVDVQEAMSALSAVSALRQRGNATKKYVDPGRKLVQAYLRNITMEGGSFQHVSWFDVESYLSHFVSIDLSRTNAVRSKFSNSEFSSAKLVGSRFRSCDLRHARFYECEMERCIFEGSDISNCRFSNVTGLEPNLFEKARYSEFVPPIFQGCLVRGGDGREFQLSDIEDLCEVQGVEVKALS